MKETSKMRTIQLNDKTFELFIPEAQIQEAVEEVAWQIKADLGLADVEEQDVLFVCMLNGAFMFASELMKAIDGPYRLAFARYSSYEGLASTGVLHEVMPVVDDVEGKTVFLVEDLIDTGFTMECMKRMMEERGAKEVKIVAMLFKPEALKCELEPDYIGLNIAPDFIVGHGLDYDGMGRAYKDIYKLKTEVYS